MDIELVTDPYACMMYIVSPLACLGGAYCGGLPPTACYLLQLVELICTEAR